MYRYLLFVIFTCCICPAGADDWHAPYITPQQLVQLDGKRELKLYCIGSGTPTVLLEGGLTSTTLTWRKVHASMAASANARVCAYDRAGMGFSDRAPFPRTALAEVEDLESLLKQVPILPPYVVVGASMGGLNMRLFTDRNRSEVIGMVLVDPAIEHQASRLGAISSKVREFDAEELEKVRGCAADAVAGALEPGSAAQKACDYWGTPEWPKPLKDWWETEVGSADYQTTILSEVESILMSDAQIESSRKEWGALPLIVLTAGEDLTPIFGDAAAEIVETWEKAHEDIARLSSVGVRRTVEGAEHDIQRSNPQAVIDAVVEVVKSAR